MENEDYPLGESPEYQVEKREEVEAAFGTPPKENPIPSVPKDKYALSESWTRGRDYKKPFDYTVEASGQTLLLKRLDMGDLLKLGIAEEMDFMTKALMTGEKKETGQEAVASAVMKADNFERMEGMINKVCHAGILKPKLLMPPLHEEARQKGLVYLDEIPFGDRMELFSVIFESDGLATFRGEQTTGVGDVETVPSVSLPPD